MKSNSLYLAVIAAAGVIRASKINLAPNLQTALPLGDGGIPGENPIIDCGYPSDLLTFTKVDFDPNPIKRYFLRPLYLVLFPPYYLAHTSNLPPQRNENRKSL
jgi:hypothetical protein